MSVQIASDRMVSSTEAVRDFAGLIDGLHKGEYFIVRHNKPAAVMMDIRQYEALQEQLAQLQTMLDHVLLYTELKARESESGEEITLAELTAKYGL